MNSNRQNVYADIKKWDEATKVAHCNNRARSATLYTVICTIRSPRIYQDTITNATKMSVRRMDRLWQSQRNMAGKSEKWTRIRWNSDTSSMCIHGYREFVSCAQYVFVHIWIYMYISRENNPRKRKRHELSMHNEHWAMGIEQAAMTTKAHSSFARSNNIQMHAYIQNTFLGWKKKKQQQQQQNSKENENENARNENHNDEPEW